MACGSHPQSLQNRARARMTERAVVLRADLCVSIELAIKCKEDKHHDWTFIRDPWLSCAESHCNLPHRSVLLVIFVMWTKGMPVLWVMKIYKEQLNRNTDMWITLYIYEQIILILYCFQSWKTRRIVTKFTCHFTCLAHVISSSLFDPLKKEIEYRTLLRFEIRNYKMHSW